jgi:serine protease
MDGLEVSEDLTFDDPVVNTQMNTRRCFMKRRSLPTVHPSLIALCMLLFTAYAGLAAGAEPARAPSANAVDGIIIKWKTEKSDTAINARIGAANGIARNRALTLRYGRKGSLGTHVLKLDRAVTAEEAGALAKEIAASDTDIEYAEPDVILQSTLVPGDPSYSQQWHYYETTAGINLPPAWSLNTGSGATVAVIDTGYRPHADLVTHVLPGYDFISNSSFSNDGNGRDSDATDPGDYATANQCAPGAPARNSSWHGTHVAGTIGALNNSIGGVGVAFNANILPVRVLGACGGESSDIADAIVWASGGTVSGVPANPYPARVLNLSLGSSQVAGCSTTFQNAINAARANGSVVVVSAGNLNANAVNYMLANCTGVVSVAAINRSGSKASYSNHGSVVTIAAPGGETSPTSSNGVLSTLNTGTTVPGSDNYVFYQGTSMAAPHVSGVAALMLSANNTLTPDGVASLLQSTSRPFPGTCSNCGSGIVDATGAVHVALGLPPPSNRLTITVGTDTWGFAYGYSQNPSFGALSPSNAIGGGLSYRAIYDFMDWDYNQYTGMYVCGFSSNPGSTWLTSITAGGVTKMGSVAGYWYGTSGTYAGCGYWSWGGATLGFPTPGQQVQVTIFHQ